ncbi:RloB family protein [Kitasatospora sp. YST-16]|uniref:RloB family protein n=1 Tax=Kitasatospora sp. YST-16 TaxID=2998080 RepID=UPI00228459D1|nr:RloB family protein [Kitasatospora sp. YST-16]WAL72085.1 RloB family protein [Kitasatospora sp. YST-16]WNW38127.1 RloB family protein [Streptomyces sp. Li-HN-5-13]
MSGIRRTTSGRRRPTGSRRLQDRILVICGAQETEKQYFESLRDERKNSNVVVKIAVEVGSPLDVVRSAIKRREQSQDDFEECWAVIDKDEFDLGPAMKLARKHGIRIALSVPCFEYWLLLHFTACNAEVPDYRGLARLLKKHLPKYDKSRLEFKHYRDGVESAVDRAAKRWESCCGEHLNPSTTVHEIVRKMI